RVYDVLGKEVATLVDKELAPDTYRIEWDARNSASGTYFYKMQAGDFGQVRRMILMK
nr:peptidase S8 [Fodinibius sp.]